VDNSTDAQNIGSEILFFEISDLAFCTRLLHNVVHNLCVEDACIFADISGFSAYLAVPKSFAQIKKRYESMA
jgi:hypothetical protein